LRLTRFEATNWPSRCKYGLRVQIDSLDSASVTLGLRLVVANGQRNVDDARGHELVLAIGLRLSILHALLVEDAPKIRDRLGIDSGRRF
jgi:hypothetical protein